ncbi:hypothetical protein Vafri_16484 [Volvox africanus]|nr:hypothetical protein Vafri_16484 [Volvox africanus]
MFGRVRQLVGRMRSVRCTGSCALGLCSVALGRCDAFFEINFGGCWDAAAGALMVSEAGGAVLDPAGGTWNVMARRVMAAGSGDLAEAMAAVLTKCELGSREAGPPGKGMGVSLRVAGTEDEAAVKGEREGPGEARTE